MDKEKNKRDRLEEETKGKIEKLIEKVDENPYDPQRYYALGCCLTELQSFEQAEELFKRALNVFEGQEDKQALLHYGLGNVFYATGLFKEASVEFKMLNGSKYESDAMLMMAQTELSNGNYQRALAYALTAFEKGNNHCGSLQKNIVIQPGEKVRLIFMLGEGDDTEGRRIREKYSDFANVDKAYKDLEKYWDDKINKLTIETPSEAMNTMINIWNLYQSEVNVMFSRFASFIEVGGRTGLGYRDTAQDSMTIPHSNPEKCKQRIVQLLNGLVSKGYGLHLFQPEWFEKKKDDKKPFKSPTVIPGINKSDIIHGIEDACSDDALWLIPSIVEYIKETGEIEFADQIVPYADKGEGTVYEHMMRILDFSAKEVGATGICLGLRADWNDCLAEEKVL
mgnify:CR=1 FL=1